MHFLAAWRVNSKFVIPQATNSKFFILHPAYSTYSRVIDKFLFHLRSFASKELISVFVSLINSKRQCILREVIYGIFRQLMLSLLFFFCSFVYVKCNFALGGWFFNCFNIIILYSYGKTVNENVQNVIARLKLAWKLAWLGGWSCYQKGWSGWFWVLFLHHPTIR